MGWSRWDEILTEEDKKFFKQISLLLFKAEGYFTYRTLENFIVQESEMREVYELLKQKELEIQRINKEMEALRITIQLLEDDKKIVRPSVPASAVSRTGVEEIPMQPVKNGHNGPNDNMIRQFP